MGRDVGHVIYAYRAWVLSRGVVDMIAFLAFGGYTKGKVL